MGRGQQAVVDQEAKQQFGTNSANAAKTGAAATSGYMAEQQNPGYTAPEKTAITGATEGGLGAAFGAAQEGAANRAARTNNSAGLTSQEDALARQRMITSGNLGAQNETNFANARISGSQNANAGLGGLFGQNLGAANSTLGIQADNARTPGFWDQFGNALAGSLGSIRGSVSNGPGGMTTSGGFG